ncbi:acyl-CoA carboxylase subunit epsilon [Allostreptomyces psammosilenae]|uniref:Acyl-CoA carboxylase subunit epsilon n=1 Tax=Allostreptomyces psammosilenae TaxID=1892865 RepID=A0A853A6M0_9ACTN|nr:acyl-CoA carboxylase subunit epsilon [Allostreptomyces psammosilenae]NYI06122.1 hypothetical protein [Allostreptomyces psammosilenae]
MTYRAEAAAVRVVRGNPTPEELAAVLAVIMGRIGSAKAAAAAEESRTSSTWVDRGRLMAPLPPPGRLAWRSSGLPH